jgi:hypothetical protein
MRFLEVGNGAATAECSSDDLYTLYHCVVEALEALSDREFQIRVGASKNDAERLLAPLKRAAIDAERSLKPLSGGERPDDQDGGTSDG